jgi:hypothetical protein
MTLIDFPTPKEPWVKPKTLEDWPWEKDLGKPYGEINGPTGGLVGQNAQFLTTSNPPEQEVNDLARWKDASPAAVSLAKAINLIDGDRDKSHGDRKENFGMIAALWSAYLGVEIKPHQVCWCMVLVKAARESNGTHSLDNAIDAAGYAALAGELATGLYEAPEIGGGDN